MHAQDIKKAMGSIRYNIRQIEQNHGECLTAISAEQSRESSNRLEELMKETNTAASQVRIHGVASCLLLLLEHVGRVDLIVDVAALLGQAASQS